MGDLHEKGFDHEGEEKTFMNITVENEMKDEKDNLILVKTQNVINDSNFDIERKEEERKDEEYHFINESSVPHIGHSGNIDSNKNMNIHRKKCSESLKNSEACNNSLRKVGSAPLQRNLTEHDADLIKKSESNDANHSTEIKKHKVEEKIINEKKFKNEIKIKSKKEKKKRKKSKEEKEEEKRIREQEKKLRVSTLIRAAEEAENERKRKYIEESDEKERKLIEEIETLDKMIMEKEIHEKNIEEERKGIFDEELDAREKQLVDEIEAFDK